ncbi:MAG: DMT family transporter [Pseudomonadota bacterium]|nr:DMT family transporter [Pseudomonadota bacterium]
MALFWATSYPIGVWLANYKAPEAIVVVRVFTAFLFLVVIAKVYRIRIFKFNEKIFYQLVALGFFGFVVHNYLMFIGLQFTTAIKGALINGAIPIVVRGLDFLLFRIVIKPAMLVGSIISFIGVLLIITDGQLGEAMKSGIGFGEALFLVAIVGWGFYSIIAKPLLDKNPAIWITAFPCLFGGILLMPLLMQNLENSMIMLTNRHVVLVLVAQGLLTMGLGFLWYYEGIKELGTASASMYLNLVPVFGAGLAYILVNEQLSKTIIFGGILTIFGVIWVNWCRINDTSKNQS